MDSFRSWDGTRLSFRVVGSGPPVMCIPGGPGQAVEYLGELGGLSRHRTLILLDNRGAGASGVPVDPATYRVDRLVDDVEALRQHLGLGRIDLLGHFYDGFQPDPRLPGELAALAVPTLLLAGEYDIWPTAAAVRRLAALLPTADVVTQPESGHFPWVDDPAAFVASVEAFLAA